MKVERILNECAVLGCDITLKSNPALYGRVGKVICANPEHKKALNAADMANCRARKAAKIVSEQ